MGQNLFYKAYQSLVHQHPKYVEKKNDRHALHQLKAKAAHDRGSLSQLIDRYRDKNGQVPVLYLKVGGWGLGKVYVSCNPPALNRPLAREAYKALQRRLGIDSTGTVRITTERHRQPDTRFDGDASESQYDSRADAAAVESDVNGSAHGSDVPVPESHGAQDIHASSPSPEQAVHARVEVDQVQIRTEELRDAMPAKDLHHDAPRDPPVATAITNAREPDKHWATGAFPEALRFPAALALELPRQPDGSTRTTPAAKLDYYLHKTDLPEQLTREEWQQVISYIKQYNKPEDSNAATG